MVCILFLDVQWMHLVTYLSGLARGWLNIERILKMLFRINTQHIWCESAALQPSIGIKIPIQMYMIDILWVYSVIVHWLISSKNVRAFMIKSEFFPAISIIIAPNKEHWYAAYATDEGRSKYGTKARSPGSEVINHLPTYLRCREDFCANNCLSCQSAPDYVCLCNNRRMSRVPTIEEDLEDLVWLAYQSYVFLD